MAAPAVALGNYFLFTLADHPDHWADEGPSRAYWQPCQEYFLEEPPSGWDSVFSMTHNSKIFHSNFNPPAARQMLPT